MKKVILGTGLLICGVLGILTAQLREAIYFASPNSISSIGNDPLQSIGITLFLVGIVLNIWGFIEKNKKE